MSGEEILPSIFSVSDGEVEATLNAFHNLPSVERQLILWIDLLTNPTGGIFIPNIWLRKNGLHVYVRQSKRKVGSVMIRCLDIAGVEVQNQDRGTGRFTAFLHYAATVNPWDAIYFESVHNKWLQTSFRQRGYLEVGNPISPNFFYFTNKSVEAKFNEPKPVGMLTKKGRKK